MLKTHSKMNRDFITTKKSSIVIPKLFYRKWFKITLFFK